MGTLFRGVRAARRATADNPDDAAAYQALGELYLRLRRQTAERAWGPAEVVARARAAQVAYACNQAVRAAPGSVAARATLADLYAEIGFFDAALDHARELAARRRAAGPAGGETPDQFRARQTAADDLVDRLRERVDRGEAELARTPAARPAARAAAAARAGLPARALDILLASDISAIGRDGVELELNLLLGLGRADDLAEWLTPELGATLDPTTYRSLRALAELALGNYAAAEAEFGRLAPAAGGDPAATRRAVALGVGVLAADGAVPASNVADGVIRDLGRNRLKVTMREAADGLARAAESAAVQAWVALERGDAAAAAGHADRALRTAGTIPFRGRDLATGVRDYARPAGADR